MATYDEVMAIAAANQSGMDDEERRRRQALILATVQRDPDLAKMIASGPYQMRDDVGATATPQEGWSRGPQPQYPPQSAPNTPIMSTIDQWRNSATPQQRAAAGINTSPAYGQPVQPSSSGPVSYNNSYSQSQQGGPQAYTSPGYSMGYSAPQASDGARGPYNNPFISPGQPTININVNGQPQGQQQQAPQPRTPDWSSADAAMQWSLAQPSLTGGMSRPPMGPQQGPPTYDQSQQYWDQRFSNQAGAQVNPYAPYSLNANPTISQQFNSTPAPMNSVRYWNTLKLAGQR